MQNGQLAETVKIDPNKLPMSIRMDDLRIGTSGPAGKFLPLCAVPLLRNDRARGGMVFNLELEELSEMLMNSVSVRFYAYLYPTLAFERFQDMGSVNRSYTGEPEVDGKVIPWIKTRPHNSTEPFTKIMGLHEKDGTPVNDMYLEAFNGIWNYRAQKRSRKITKRDLLDTSLPPAFWPADEMSNILPDFDQAMIDAEVPITFLDNRIHITGIARQSDAGAPTHNNRAVYEYDGEGGDGWDAKTYEKASELHQNTKIYMETTKDGVPKVQGAIREGDVTMSLSLMEMAKKAANQASVREKYKDLAEDHVIDILMEGIDVPEELLNRPILLDRDVTMFGMNSRYATDSGNLEKSLTTGETEVSLQWNTPRINTGGVIMICAEVVPERIFERQKDYFYSATERADLPNNTADFLDPEKVTVIQNRHIDVKHTNPDATFGYAPLNKHWNRDIPRLGGKFYRPDPNAVADENRNRVWANETVDPELTEDFYLATELNDKVFNVQGVDQVEFVGRGEVAIVGLTQMGKTLVEDSDSYEQIIDLVDKGTIDQTA